MLGVKIGVRVDFTPLVRYVVPVGRKARKLPRE